MSDSETRAVLIALCESVKAEYRYLWGLHGSMTRVLAALNDKVPGFADSYQAQGILPQEFPDIRARLERLDELLQQLKKV